jgi:hypothetical protein
MADIVDRSAKAEAMAASARANTPDLVELTDLAMAVGLPLQTGPVLVVATISVARR